MRHRSPIRALVLAVILVLPGCYASNVVARQDRAVQLDAAELQFGPVTATDVPGLYASVAIEGEAAVSLRQIYYWFGDGGSYSGAALVDDGSGLSFQTLAGTWRLVDGRLQLDDAAPVEVEVAPGHLRLGAEGGVVVLQRTTLR